MLKHKSLNTNKLLRDFAFETFKFIKNFTLQITYKALDIHLFEMHSLNFRFGHNVAISILRYPYLNFI
jgi:hypothetical protein